MLKEGFTPWTPISPSNAEAPESSGTKPDNMPVEEGLSPRKIEVIPKEERPEVLDPISRPSVSASMAPEIRDTDVEVDAEDGPETVDEQPEHRAPEPEFTMARPPPQATAARSRFAPPAQDAASIPPAPSHLKLQAGVHQFQEVDINRLNCTKIVPKYITGMTFFFSLFAHETDPNNAHSLQG
ncbi:hypothetical protein R1sor_012837 [Riccia sorocarpa]|uniref:Uncharacterized protein n=1 Tax=Riccia sorocarpa TaxID=122646 RepID=A0ABD3I615_9MARC